MRQMEYVLVGWEPEYSGFDINPDPYTEELPKFLDSLPPGARGFVSDPDHFSFSSLRCVKDLQLAEITTATNKDDVLPLDGGGCSHEIELTDSRVYVECAELTAIWD